MATSAASHFIIIPQHPAGYQYSALDQHDGVGANLTNSPYYLITGTQRGNSSDTFKATDSQR